MHICEQKITKFYGPSFLGLPAGVEHVRLEVNPDLLDPGPLALAVELELHL